MDAMNLLLQFIILFREINLTDRYLPQVLIHHRTKVIHNCIRKVFFFIKDSSLAPPHKNKKLLFIPGIFDSFVFTCWLPQTMISNYCRDDESGWEPWRNAVMCAHVSKSLRRPLQPYLVPPEVKTYFYVWLPKTIVLLMLLCGLINVLLYDHIIFKYIRSISVGKEIRNWWVNYVADSVSVGANIQNLVHT